MKVSKKNIQNLKWQLLILDLGLKSDNTNIRFRENR